MGLFNIKPSEKDPLLKRFDSAVMQYQELFDEEINTVTMVINERTVTDIERCVKEHVRLRDIWPEIELIESEDDI